MITTEKIIQLAKLSKIKISSQQFIELQKELNIALDLIKDLKSVSVDDTEPLIYPFQMQKNVHLHWRADIVKKSTNIDPQFFLKNAPDFENHYFLVPKVIE